MFPTLQISPPTTHTARQLEKLLENLCIYTFCESFLQPSPMMLKTPTARSTTSPTRTQFKQSQLRSRKSTFRRPRLNHSSTRGFSSSLPPESQPTDHNLFGAPPPASKTKEDEVILDLPNTINKFYEANKAPLMSLTLKDLTAQVEEMGLPKYRAKQIYQWVYQRGASSFDEMTTLSKNERQKLNETFFLYPVDMKYVATSLDASRKYVFQVQKKDKKGDTIESVFIPRVFDRVYDSSSVSTRDQWDNDLDNYGNLELPSVTHDGNIGKKAKGRSDIITEVNEEEIDAVMNATNYDVSTFLEYQNSYKKLLIARGKLDPGLESTGTDLNSLKIVPNFDQKLHAAKNPQFIPDFLQAPQTTTITHEDGSTSIHEFDQSQFRYQKGAVCFSSQHGCTLSCSFCHTGTMPKSELRNLTTGEIIGQIMAIKQDLNDFDGRRPDRKDGQKAPQIVGSVVAMGQGEPGYNLNNILRSIDILTEPDGLNMGRRHITISTSGVVTSINKLAEHNPVNLAISLHAVTDELRDKLMPINKTFNLAALMDACRNYPGVKRTRKVTFEYIMLNGINDSDADARELLRLIHGIPSLVNLIPFNSWPGSNLSCSSMNRIRRFQQIINDTTNLTGIRATVRKTQGQSELAACGTLNSKLSTSLLKHVNKAKILDPNAQFGDQMGQVNLVHVINQATKL